MKVLGELFREDLLSMLDSFSMTVMTRGLGMGGEQVKQLLEGMKKDIWSNRIRVYVPVLVGSNDDLVCIGCADCVDVWYVVANRDSLGERNLVSKRSRARRLRVRQIFVHTNRG